MKKKQMTEEDIKDMVYEYIKNSKGMAGIGDIVYHVQKTVDVRDATPATAIYTLIDEGKVKSCTKFEAI